nr:CarD family transcriptional regulator [Roseicella aerolata]
MAFAPGEPVVHPVHGVGRVEGLHEEAIGSERLVLICLSFEAARLRLKVPRDKAARVGLRPLSTPQVMEQVMAVLRGRPRASRGAWIRRGPEYEAKVTSGDPRLVAEVLRDLGAALMGPESSFSEQKIAKAALDQLAGELAALTGSDRAAAVASILAVLAEAKAGPDRSGGGSTGARGAAIVA